MPKPFGTGARPSHKDLRTKRFTYQPVKGGAPIPAPVKAGSPYEPQFIEMQAKEGICTAIHLTQMAHKVTGTEYSADFQYLMQKVLFDSKYPIGWGEGSSNLVAYKTAAQVGFLPQSEWTHTTQADRNLPYDQYIAKLRAIPQAEIDRLTAIAGQNKLLSAYQPVPLTRDAIASAIQESQAGVACMFRVDKHWWTNKAGQSSWSASDLEPIGAPTDPATTDGHAIIMSNVDGNSWRVANTWSTDWAEQGTAYSTFDYMPQECWLLHFTILGQTPSPQVQQLLAQKTQLQHTLLGLLQQLLAKLLKQYHP